MTLRCCNRSQTRGTQGPRGRHVALAFAAIATTLGQPRLAPATPTPVALAPTSGPPTVGEATAPIVVELFYAPDLTQSRDALAAVRSLVTTHPARVRAVIVPIATQIERPLAATALWVAHAHGRFFELAEALRGPTSDDRVLAATRAVGLDPALVTNALQQRTYLPALRGWDQLRRNPWDTGNAPNLFIAGHPLDTLVPGSAIGAALEAAYTQTWRKIVAADLPSASSQTIARALAPVRTAAMAAPIPLPGSSDEPMLGRRPAASGALVQLPATPIRATPPTNSDMALAIVQRCRAIPTTCDATPRVAPVSVAVACNPRAGACQNQLATLNALALRHPDRVTVGWLPLVSARDTHDTTLADAALCAERQGQGWRFLLSSGSRTRGVHRDELNAQIAERAEAVGLPETGLWQCRAVMAGTAGRISEALVAQGATAGPVLIVGGRMYRGPLPVGMLLALVTQQRDTGWLETLAPAWRATTDR